MYFSEKIWWKSANPRGATGLDRRVRHILFLQSCCSSHLLLQTNQLTISGRCVTSCCFTAPLTCFWKQTNWTLEPECHIPLLQNSPQCVTFGSFKTVSNPFLKTHWEMTKKSPSGLMTTNQLPWQGNQCTYHQSKTSQQTNQSVQFSTSCFCEF